MNIDDFSPGFRCEDASVVVGMPVCLVCKNWDGPKRCKVYGDAPSEYWEMESRKCPAVEFDETAFGIANYKRLYPEDFPKE